MQKEADVGDREVEMVGHISVDHLSGIDVETGGKAPVEPGKMIHTAAVTHGSEKRDKDIA